jgi:hypothetical protein
MNPNARYQVTTQCIIDELSKGWAKVGKCVCGWDTLPGASKFRMTPRFGLDAPLNLPT